MKNKLKDNIILFCSIFYLIIFILGWLLLKSLNCSYLFYFKIISFVIIIIGIVYGTIKAIKSTMYEKKVKGILYVYYLFVEGILSLIFLFIILLPLLSQTEKIVYIENKFYIEVRYDALLSHWIYYYDFTNPIFRKNQPKFEMY